MKFSTLTSTAVPLTLVLAEVVVNNDIKADRQYGTNIIAVRDPRRRVSASTNETSTGSASSESSFTQSENSAHTNIADIGSLGIMAIAVGNLIF